MNRRAGLLWRFVRVHPYRQGSGKGSEIENDPWLELGLHLGQVELVITDKSFREFGGQQPNGGEFLSGQIEVKAVCFGDDFEDVDFEGVSRLSTADIDRAGDGVGAAAIVLFAQFHQLFHRHARLHLVERVHQGLD